MQHLDHDYVQQCLDRLAAIPNNATPRWGTLTRERLIRHFIWVFRHAMGRSRQVPYLGNLFTSRLLWPLFRHGFLRIPRNLRLPQRLTRQGVQLEEPGDLETLHALLDEYLALVQAGELKPAKHPAFGDIGIDGWDRVHVLHFEHHFRQFGV